MSVRMKSLSHKERVHSQNDIWSEIGRNSCISIDIRN
jgi:hypothetical protein